MTTQLDLIQHAAANTRQRTAQPPPAAQPVNLSQYQPLLQQLDAGRNLTGADVAYVDDAVQVWMRPGFDTFVSLPRLHFEPLPHQLRAAAAALRRMRGRAILADEVGLGKTIEALLVLSELRLRGLAERALVLVPAGLVGQWREELDRKFGLDAVVVAGPDGAADHPLLIASIASARRAPIRDVISSRRWDLVVVDEAHRVRNPHSVSGRFVRSLETRSLLLLTATPVENRLDDLFHLVNMVRPGQLGSIREFRAQHGAGGSASIRDVPALQSRMREVMIRHRRSEVEVMLPRRLAETHVLNASAGEVSLYHDVSERVRAHARAARTARLPLQVVQRAAGSSPAALLPTLRRLGWDDLAEQAAAISLPEKALALRSLLGRAPFAGNKVIVFTSFTATLDQLARVLRDAGCRLAVYHGGLPRLQKDEAIHSFEADAEVLLSSEAGGEGRNLQFCHTMINFDVPWNPMQIEQRLGRIHRIGQRQDVTLVNLVTRGTIEERILRILEHKINMFELVVGELDMILGHIEDDEEFAAQVFAAHVASEDDDELETRLEVIGEELATARRQYLESRGNTDTLVGELE